MRMAVLAARLLQHNPRAATEAASIASAPRSLGGRRRTRGASPPPIIIAKPKLPRHAPKASAMASSGTHSSTTIVGT